MRKAHVQSKEKIVKRMSKQEPMSFFEIKVFIIRTEYRNGWNYI